MTEPAADFGRRYVRSWRGCAGLTEPWGIEEVTIHAPGGPYRIAGASGEQAEELRRSYADYLSASPGPGGAGIALRRAAASDFVEIDPRGWVYDFDLFFGPEEVWLAGNQGMGLVRLGPSPAATFWTSLRTGPSWVEFFENALRVLAVHRMLDQNSVMLHSAALTRDGKALLMVGNTGRGKTSLSRIGLDAGWQVLSDDLNALALGETGELTVVKMPFAGELGRTQSRVGSYPLSDLVLLDDDADGSARLDPGKTTAALLSCCPFLNTDPHRLGRLMDLLTSLAEVRCLRPISRKAVTELLEKGF
jgi:hypothetical protein